MKSSETIEGMLSLCT